MWTNVVAFCKEMCMHGRALTLLFRAYTVQTLLTFVPGNRSGAARRQFIPKGITMAWQTASKERKWCDTHQWCMHETKDCRNIPYGGKGGKGTGTAWPPTTPTQAPATPSPSPSSTTPTPTPMRPCLYCNQLDHYKWQCPRIKQDRVQQCFNCGAPG